MIKKLVISVVILVGLMSASLYGAKSWVKGLLPDKSHFETLKQTQTQDLTYVTQDVPSYRGKILAVVTSVDRMGDDKQTGYEHTELARAYWVFVANGFEVDIASPKGGKPPVVIDGEDMGRFDYAFLNDADIQSKVNNSMPLSEINPDDYEAVYFVGGKGTMFDFPDNPDIQHITKSLYQGGKVVSAVCHGPAALVNVLLDNGESLIANKQISGFTNEEELFLIPDAKQIFPFLLEDKLREQGAQFNPGMVYLEQVVQDGKLITGQNPWSVWKMAEMVVAELGYEPKVRKLTPEEYSVALLMTYKLQGFDAAIAMVEEQPEVFQRILILMHGIMALMKWDIVEGIDLFSIASRIRDLTA
ncbi:type 1 glutamine amidotransferase domain-containing protein [Alteromonas sp. KUL49]|uniref:type 1 glutamine amidotransferase domain-containing protein n=1 Tax=Alteromonas sp. KUL49 TaxID=2480798 RepID=UPI00102EFE5B|nr:type 1 glutamine amidotransferase domain-containing protein [Alteromonas sp. KUL49]TAP41527.1 type 1 glutamine amidotransferase domain-containing protein [Alteromonas sp. KUL49]GEA10621.1 hypothetical protein KUL49_09960 [Alteromonas sp. KUL49]